MGRPEYEGIEFPLIKQLTAMGWRHLEGAPPGHFPTDPRRSGREDFKSVLFEKHFRAAIYRINPGPDSSPWLDEHRLDQITDLVLRRLGSGFPGNLRFTDTVREKVTVEGLPDWDNGTDQRVRLFDFDRPERNDLLAVSQFRIDRPDHNPVVLDVVLFVNGLPLVVIECKRPGPQALDDAVDQILGYASAHQPDAVPELVRFAQILVATTRERAQLATVTAEPRHFVSWRTVEPASTAEVLDELGKSHDRDLLPQEELVAGVLRPAHLLSLIRDFMITGGSGISTVKIMARWHQFRAVYRILAILRERQNGIQAGRPYRRKGGLVWHTQGSGKSFTMTFLVRCLRMDPLLSIHKVVVVTDRIDLQSQIRGSLQATGETVHTASDITKARRDLALKVSDLVMVTIQKAQPDEDSEADSAGDTEPTEAELSVDEPPLNDSPTTIVLVDEAHRSQDGVLHARLRAMLPEAVMFGFTGTPIIKGRKKRTDEIFGDVLDAYSLQNAIDDDAIVPVRYEARLPKFAVIRDQLLDSEFEAAVSGTRRQRRRVMRRLARRKEVLESSRVIEHKAQDMFTHWVRTAMPDGFGAQVIAVSRLAAVRYRDAVLAARNRLLEELDDVAAKSGHDPMAYETASDRERELLDLLKWRDHLAAIDAAVVISQSGKDKGRKWKKWTLPSEHKAHIKRFKLGADIDSVGTVGDPWQASTHGGPTGTPSGSFSMKNDPWSGNSDPTGSPDDNAENSDSTGPLTFLMVKSMLLTGFDAPVEQVIYLDRGMGGVELLQAMARTNRPYQNKAYGLVVDYIGVYTDMRRALGDYEKEHLRQVIGGREAASRTVWKGFNESEVPRLRAEYHRVLDVLGEAGIDHLDTLDQREDLLAELSDPVLRARFDDRVRDFLSALNAVLPRPQALRYTRFAKQVGEVQYLARSRYRDDHREFSPRRYGAKVRALIDEHLRVRSIQQKMPPLDITAADYLEKLTELRDDRARALDMASGLRTRIDLRLPASADQERYERLSERLKRITLTMERNFEEAARDLRDLVEEEREATREESEAGPDYFTVRPVRILLERALENLGEGPEELGRDVQRAASDIAVRLADSAALQNFVDNAHVQKQAVTKILRYIESELGLWRHQRWATQLAHDLVGYAVRHVEDFRTWGHEDKR